MENAEEVLQLLEEFTKMRPKEIPKELEDYLGYVAKSGDPVYQWSLVKNLFREKLIKVITDFFESTLTVELPPCPNVEPFNYDRMKNSLLERFDTFNSAPFTVQRICELLTNPRKEYNRADKYMRAIEKNILVVSTREPGTGKRPLDNDSQQETILNGMPDVKINESDGTLMHVPTDLPYLGAPPASNDVTVETSEPILANPVSDRVGFGIDITEESKTEGNDSIKSWVAQEPLDPVIESEQACSTSELLDVEETFNKEKCNLEIRDCDADSRFVDLENCPSNSTRPLSDTVSESSSPNVLILKNEIVVSETASIDSSDSSLNINKVQDSFGEPASANDENEVSSTPTDIVAETLVLEEEIDVPLDSEAEATGSSVESLQSVGKLTDQTENEINSSERIIESNDTLSIVTVTEVSGSNDSGETTVECSENEITGTVDSPTSPVSNLSSQTEDLVKLDKISPLIIEECEQSDIHPADSSNDVSEPPKEIKMLPVEDLMNSDNATLEADSISESDEVLSKTSEQLEGVPDQNSSNLIQCGSPSVQVSPSLDITNIESVVGLPLEEPNEKVLEESVLPTSSVDQIIGNDTVCIDSVQEEDPKLANSSLSINQVAQVGPIYEQEHREESVIQTLPNVPSDSLKEMVEDISVDTGCEVEEEAMDVDDSSNQMMMISEGENEGEPMDQSDQLQS